MSIITTVIVSDKANAERHCTLTKDDDEYVLISKDPYEHNFSLDRTTLAMLLLLLRGQTYSKKLRTALCKRVKTVYSESSCSVDLFPPELVRLLSQVDRDSMGKLLDTMFDLPEVKQAPNICKPKRSDTRRLLFRLRELSRIAVKEKKDMLLRYTF